MAKVKVLNGNTHPITLIMRGKPEDEVTKVHVPSAEKSSDGKKLIAATFSQPLARSTKG
jgi:hypothetical protein